MRDLKKLFKENRYGIVHAHLTTMSVFSLAAAKSCGVPVRICHGHNTACKSEWKKNLLKVMLRPFSSTFATHYFACSDYAGKWLFGKNIAKSERYRVIPNAVEADKFRFNGEVRREVRKELGVENNLVLGHIGRFAYQKNHAFLMDIFNEVLRKDSGAVLLLVGEGSLLNEVKQKVHHMGLDAAVRFLGVREDVDRLYQAFDVFCLPSRYEGLPVVGVEAQISGVPCVFSGAMTKETAFTNGVTFVDLERSAEEWAQIILECAVKDRSIVQNVGNFEISDQARELGRFYEFVIEQTQ